MIEVEAFPSADRHEVELRVAGEIERLPGVVAAAVWINGDGDLRHARIHVLPGVAPTIISNATGRVLESLAIGFEHRAIQVRQITLPDDLQGIVMASAPPVRYLVLQDISLNRSGAHVTCRVQLMHDAVVAFGEARELDTTAGRARAAANATLRAAENANPDLALGLEAATLTQLFGRTYAAVSVEASIGRRAATLSGMVPVDPGRAAEEAVCLATLRAIDRWIGQ
jgi:hypothetical protein